MVEFVEWPRCLLYPAATAANPVPFTRGGGRSLNGLERAVRTDLGFWSIELMGMVIRTKEQKRAWNRIRTDLSGRAGLAIVPVESWDTRPWKVDAAGAFDTSATEEWLPHSDETPHSDVTPYAQTAAYLQLGFVANIGDTTIQLVAPPGVAAETLSGIRFSWNHALYETGRQVSGGAGPVLTFRVFPSIRAPIPANAPLETDFPTCLVHLAEDRGMDLPEGTRVTQEADVAWIEAVEYWNDLAAGDIT